MKTAKSTRQTRKPRTKVSRACDNCRKRKIKCSGRHPCSSCEAYGCACKYSTSQAVSQAAKNPLKGTSANHDTDNTNTERFAKDTCLYTDNSAEVDKITFLRKCVRRLESAMLQPQAVSEAIDSLKMHIHKLEEDCVPRINVSELRSHVDSSSTETRLLQTKNKDQVFMSKSSYLEPKNSALNKLRQPVVDSMFGLYSPNVGLTPNGILSLFRSAGPPPENKAAVLSMKETLYIMLRFFDMCIVNLDKSHKMWSAPIQFYYSVVSPSLPGKESAGAGSLFSKVPAPLVSRCRERHPLFGMRPDLLRADREAASPEEQLFTFLWAVCLLETHHYEFRVSTCPLFAADGHADGVIEGVSRFLQMEEVLSTLSFDFFLRTIYTDDGILEYLEALLIFIEQQYWIEEFLVLPRLLSAAITYARNMGLHRWEFYVGLEEQVAERRRVAWWKCYVWDAFISVSTGKQPTVEDRMITCLYPKCARDLGFINQGQLLRSLQHLKAPPRLNFYETLQFAQLALAHAISDFYNNVLYSPEYTDFRNYAKPEMLTNKVVAQLLSDVDTFKARLASIRVHAAKILDLALSASQGNPPAGSETEELYHATQFSLQYEFSGAACLASSDHLLARFSRKELPAPLQATVHKNKQCIYEAWKRSVTMFLSQSSVYGFWQSLRPVCAMLFFAVTEYFAHYKEITEEDLALMLRASIQLDRISELYNKPPGKDADSGRAWKHRLQREYQKEKTFFQIVTRLCLQFYSNLSGHDSLTVVQSVAGEDPTLASTIRELLDARSEHFRQCLVSKEQSGFHVELRNTLEKEEVLKDHQMGLQGEFGDEYLSRKSPKEAASSFANTSSGFAWQSSGSLQFKESSYSKRAPVNNTTETVSPYIDGANGIPFDIFNLGTLDEFINDSRFPTFYDSLWDDVSMGGDNLSRDQSGI